MSRAGVSGSAGAIWIDLDNAPHVPFFRPLIRGLEDRGHRVWVTARDEPAVRRLIDVFGIECDVVGRGRGRTSASKAAVVLRRAWQLRAASRGRAIALAVSHGSRPQALAARATGVRAMCLLDYEYVATGLLRRCCDTFLVPDRITDEDLRQAGLNGRRVLRYPGLKENVYLRDEAPPPPADDDIVVLYRPESPTAHYLKGRAGDVEDALLARLASEPRVMVMLVAREPEQERRIAADLYARGIRWRRPAPAPGRELIGSADLVVTGGGTMAREAAALDVPAASIFRGREGAVDRALAAEGRLRLIRTAAEAAALPLSKRAAVERPADPGITYRRVLDAIEGVHAETARTA